MRGCLKASETVRAANWRTDLYGSTDTRSPQNPVFTMVFFSLSLCPENSCLTQRQARMTHIFLKVAVIRIKVADRLPQLSRTWRFSSPGCSPTPRQHVCSSTSKQSTSFEEDSAVIFVHKRGLKRRDHKQTTCCSHFRGASSRGWRHGPRRPWNCVHRRVRQDERD